MKILVILAGKRYEWKSNTTQTDPIAQVCAQLDETQLHTNIHNGIGSIHTTLVHIVSGIWIWRTCWQGGMPDRMLRPEDFPTLAAIWTKWDEEERLTDNFLATLQDKDLLCEVRYIGTMVPDKFFILPLWKTMLHLTNHMTQHRSKIAMKLTEWRHSPGELGMNVFFNR